MDHVGRAIESPFLAAQRPIAARPNHCSHFGLFDHLECVVGLDAGLSDCAPRFWMTERQLYGPEVAAFALLFRIAPPLPNLDKIEGNNTTQISRFKYTIIPGLIACLGCSLSLATTKCPLDHVGLSSASASSG